jgi:hypothetical protein
VNRVRIARDGPRPGAYCPDCGDRLGNAFGPSEEGRYFVSLGTKWLRRHRDDGRVEWRKSHRHHVTRGFGRVGVQDYETILCRCGAELTPP